MEQTLAMEEEVVMLQISFPYYYKKTVKNAYSYLFFK